MSAYLTGVTTHVEDVLIVAPSKADLQHFHQLLKAEWDLSTQAGDELSYIGHHQTLPYKQRTAVSQQ